MQHPVLVLQELSNSCFYRVLIHCVVLLNLRCACIYICGGGGGEWNDTCMEVEAEIIVAKLMAKY